MRVAHLILSHSSLSFCPPSLPPSLLSPLSLTSPLPHQMTREGSNSPSPRHQAFAYSIIHTDDVPLRNNPIPRKPHPFRKSQSVEHLYEMARSLDNPSLPPTPQTPPTSMDDFHLNSHIYSDLHNDDEGVAGDGWGDEGAGVEGRESLSPVRDVPHVSVDDRLYAVVVKPLASGNKDNEVEEHPVSDPRDSTSPPPPLPPPPRVTKPPPIKPAPYSSTIGEANKITTTKAGDKYAHFLNSSPPTRPLPIPTQHGPHPPSSPKCLEPETGPLPKKLVFEHRQVSSSRPHMYDEVDFENHRPNRRSLDATPPHIRSHGKIRQLKPKERPAPPPPQEV